MVMTFSVGRKYLLRVKFEKEENEVGNIENVFLILINLVVCLLIIH